MLQTRMLLSHPLQLIAAGCFLVLGFLTPLQAQTAERAAFGLIVGYKAHADDLSPEETERGPWSDHRKRANTAWERAVERSRARTKQLAKETGVAVRSVDTAGRSALMRFDRPLRGAALDDALRRVGQHPDVEWVEANVLVPRLQVTPNDTLFPSQWHLQTAGVGFEAALNLPNAWAVTQVAPLALSTPVTMAVVDSGIRPHPDLSYLPGHDFVSEALVENDADAGRDTDPTDPGDWVSQADLANPIFQSCDVLPSSWHGTFIAGQLAALTNNLAGVAGINWNARLLPVRVSGKCGALVSDLIDGVRWAAGLQVQGAPNNANPARVINLSFGGDRACGPAYQTMIDELKARGVLLVVAAGNASGALTRPADCQGVMAVAAVRRDGAKAEYSSFGANVALAAPGGSAREPGDLSLAYRSYGDTDVLLRSTDNAGTTVPGADTYGYKQGTSFSAPQAVGVASLMLARNPDLTPADLINRMRVSARAHTVVAGLSSCTAVNRFECNCTTDTCGAGLLDAAAALTASLGPAAVIRPIGTVAPGARITLDGSDSSSLDASPAIQTYTWSQISGSPVALQSPTQSIASATLPNLEGRWEFRLTVSDGTRSGTDTVVVTAAFPSSSGGGGGSTGWVWGLALWAWLFGLGMALRPRRTR